MLTLTISPTGTAALAVCLRCTRKLSSLRRVLHLEVTILQHMLDAKTGNQSMYFPLTPNRSRTSTQNGRLLPPVKLLVCIQILFPTMCLRKGLRSHSSQAQLGIYVYHRFSKGRVENYCNSCFEGNIH